MKKCIFLLTLGMLLLCSCSNQSSGKGQTDYCSSVNSSTQDNSLLVSQKEPYSSPEVPEPTMELEATPKQELEATPKQYMHEVHDRIHETMPEYRFVALGSEIFVRGLEVYNENNGSILSVEFDPESCPVYPEMMDTMGLHITDVNFDGYKDVIILNCFHGAHSNSWYDCWLWDVETSAFIHSESFMDICNPALDPIKQCIYSTGGSGASYRGWNIYKFINGKFSISNRLSFEGLHDEVSGKYLGLQITEEALIDGKMEIVHSEVISEDVPFDETDYNNDELWQLENSRWYGVGGHHADKWLE